MTEFKVDKGVPVPAQRRAASRYPFASMDVGDSFVVSHDIYGSTVTAAAHYAKRHPGVKFTSRKFANGTARIWRVA